MLKAFTPSVENRFTHHFSVHLSAAQPAKEKELREKTSASWDIFWNFSVTTYLWV